VVVVLTCLDTTDTSCTRRSTDNHRKHYSVQNFGANLNFITDNCNDEKYTAKLSSPED